MSRPITPREFERFFPNATNAAKLRNAANSAGGALTIEQHKEKLKVDLERLSRMTILPTTDEAKLNKTERAYHEHLKRLNYQWIGVQNLTFKLADDTRFTPDFTVVEANEMRCIDVKGFQREDALIKIRVAARMFPWVTFAIVKKDKDGWNMMMVKP